MHVILNDSPSEAAQAGGRKLPAFFFCPQKYSRNSPSTWYLAVHPNLG